MLHYSMDFRDRGISTIENVTTGEMNYYVLLAVISLFISLLSSCSLLNHLHSFHGETFKLNAKFEADSLLYSISHFE